MDSQFAFVGKDYVLLASDTNVARSIVVNQNNYDKIHHLSAKQVMAISGEMGDVLAFREFIAKNIALIELKLNRPMSTFAIAHFCRRQLADNIRKSPFSVNGFIAGWDATSDEHPTEPPAPDLDYNKFLQEKEAAESSSDASPSGGESDSIKTASTQSISLIPSSVVEETEDDSAKPTTLTQTQSTAGAASLYYFDYLGTLHPVERSAHGYCSYFVLGTMDRYWKPNLSREDGVKLAHRCIDELRTRLIINHPTFHIKIITKDGIEVLTG